MPNPIKDLIEKRKKPVTFSEIQSVAYTKLSEEEIVATKANNIQYNSALTDLANDPTFLKSLEDGLVERVIGADDEVSTTDSDDKNWAIGRNNLRKKQRDIIKSYFNPEK